MSATTFAPSETHEATKTHDRPQETRQNIWNHDLKAEDFQVLKNPGHDTAQPHLNGATIDPEGISFHPPAFAEHCDFTGTPAPPNSAGTDTSSAMAQSDPNLAKIVGDVKAGMSPEGASQFEANVDNNFTQNNGQFQTDSSLLNASIGQMNGQNIAASDIAAAQNISNADINTLGDAQVSTYAGQTIPPDAKTALLADGTKMLTDLLSGLQTGDFSQLGNDLSALKQDVTNLQGQNSTTTGDGGATGAAPGGDQGGVCTPGGDQGGACTPGGDQSGASTPGGAQSGTDVLAALQTDLANVMQDIANGDTQKLLQDLPQFIQDLMTEFTSLLGDLGGAIPQSTSDAPAGSADGTNPTPAAPTQTGTDGTTTASSDPTQTGNDGTQANPSNPGPLGSIVTSDGTAAQSDVQQVQTALANGTPQSLLNALQQSGTKIDVTGTDIGSAGLYDPTTGQITISDNANEGGGGQLMQEATLHEVVHNWDQQTGFTDSSQISAAFQKDIANLPAGALNNIPIALIDGTTMTAPDGTPIGISDVTAEIGTYIAAQDKGDNAVAASGAGAQLAQLFPSVYALEKQAIG